MKDEELWRMLDSYEGAKPTPGLKARILSNIRKPNIIRYLMPLAAAAGILIAVFAVNDLTKTTPIEVAISEEEEIDENLELLANYDVVQYIDLLEDEETLSDLEEFVQ